LFRIFVQFFTFNQSVTQCWLIKNDSFILKAASMIHTDFMLKFKIAKTISLENFVQIKD
jgi:ribosome-binding ATPase YchF (GTP1/OBG family)